MVEIARRIREPIVKESDIEDAFDSITYDKGGGVLAMAESYLGDQKRILPCAVYVDGKYGLDGLYVGVPTVIGANGVEEIVEISLDAEAKKNLQVSVEAVKELLVACKQIEDHLVAIPEVVEAAVVGPEVLQGDVERVHHALATEAVAAVAQLDRLMGPRARPTRDRGPAGGAVVQDDFHLQRRVAAAVEDFAGGDVENGGHGGLLEGRKSGGFMGGRRDVCK